MNAASSTGPTTAEGKATSSQNATRHGLCSSSVLIPGENAAEYEALKDDLIYHFAPKTPAESAYVDIIVTSTWRLQHIAGIEASIYARCDNDGDAFLKYGKELMNLARYQNTIQRGADRAKKELFELQKTRLFKEQNGFVRQKKHHPRRNRTRSRPSASSSTAKQAKSPT